MIKKVQAPLQNNLVVDEKGDDEEIDLEIHCLGDTSSSPHLTQSSYEETLMDNQINELTKGDKTKENPNRYNLRSKKKAEKTDTYDHPTKTESSAKAVASRSKEKDAQIP